MFRSIRQASGIETVFSQQPLCHFPRGRPWQRVIAPGEVAAALLPQAGQAQFLEVLPVLLQLLPIVRAEAALPKRPD